MSIEVKTPVLPESVNDAVVINWAKKQGEVIKEDDLLVELETDKVVLEVPSPVNGIIESIIAKEGTAVTSDQLLGILTEKPFSEQVANGNTNENPKNNLSAEKTAPTPSNQAATSPSVRKALKEHNLQADEITGTGKNGRILKEDVLKAAKLKQQDLPARSKEEILTTSEEMSAADGRIEQRVPMTRLRSRIAERLLEASQTTAMLTTFNEVNMQPLMEMRSKYKDLFEKTHNARLGYMSLFVKASTLALQRFPEVNASIDESDILYHNYCDIGIAISSARGLVVPILRNTEFMSMANIESAIVDFADQAKDGKLDINDLQGGTFTITNGGVFGSLLSTPILNPPQSAILGMHAINKRPVVENDEIVIRPVMFLALSYDHRIIDGQSAVLFLRTIKELIEDPQRILLEV